MLRYPDKVRLGGVEVEVLLTQEPLLHPADGKTRLNGCMMMGQKLMVLYDNRESRSSVEETFVHELIEGIIDVYDLHFEDPSNGRVYSMPHSAIKTLGVALHQALAEARIDFGQSVLNTTTH